MVRDGWRDGRGSRLATRVAVALATLGLVVAGLVVTCAPQLSLAVPGWVVRSEGTYAVDFDGNGSEELVELYGRVCTVHDAQGTTIYATDGSWQVASTCCGDVDRDGLPDIALLVWRRGNYGSSRPFWEDSIDLRMTEHLFVLSVRDGAVRQRWMGHELGAPVERVVYEAPGQLILTTTDGARARWTWKYFGFSIEERIDV